MKISALSPQFVVESPEASEEPKSKAHAETPDLKIVGSEKAASADHSGGHLDRETRDGLKRLSRLIQGKKLKSRRALARYAAVENGQNPLTGIGANLDLAA